MPKNFVLAFIAAAASLTQAHGNPSPPSPVEDALKLWFYPQGFQPQGHARALHCTAENDRDFWLRLEPWTISPRGEMPWPSSMTPGFYVQISGLLKEASGAQVSTSQKAPMAPIKRLGATASLQFSYSLNSRERVTFLLLDQPTPGRDRNGERLVQGRFSYQRNPSEFIPIICSYDLELPYWWHSSVRRR